MTWLIVLSACSGPTGGPGGSLPARPPSFEDPHLESTGAGPVIRLGPEGRFTLPPTVLPAGFEPASRFPIVVEERPFKVRRNTRVYRGTSPFYEVVEDEGRVSAPPGMHLYAGDQELRFDTELGGVSWKLSGSSVLIALAGEEVPEISVAYPGLEHQIRRRDLATSGLPPERFVPFEVTLDSRTRDGLLLPAPSTAEWDLTVPAGGQFEGWLALAPLPLRNITSDGAEVALEVVDGAQVVVVERRSLSPEDEFSRWRVDLGRWAGRPVTLRLTTSPGATPDFDYVFVGSPTVWGAPSGPVRRIVVIGLDTTRPDHFGFYGYPRNTTPELDAVAASSVVFERAWAPAPRTRPSFRTAFTGRRPLDAVGARNAAEVFHELGFVTAGITANVHLQPRFEFDEGFDDWWYDGSSKAGEQVDRALAFLDHYPDRDSFLFLHVMDPHLFYNAPGAMAEMFTEDPDPSLPDRFTRWDVYDWARGRQLTDRRRDHIVARYDAELRYTSQELGRLFARLDALPGRSLVVLHSDHGEEFWEHGAFEHNHSVFDETTRVLLWFRSGPGQVQGRRVTAPVTLADIAPTLFDLAGIAAPPPTDGRSLKGVLLGGDDGASLTEREIGVAHLRYDTERWAVVWREHKYVLHTVSGVEELYDLRSDPTERDNLVPSQGSTGVDLEPYRQALARAHGMEVGPGWRIAVDLPLSGGRSTYVLRFPTEAVAVGIMDPEASKEVPANQAWGEVPEHTPADVGSFELAEDKRSAVFTPGSAPKGYLYVRFGAPTPAEPAQIERDGLPLLTMFANQRVTWRAGADLIEVHAGTVVVPPVGEGARMAAVSGAPSDFDLAGQRQMLCDLGYLQCDDAGEPREGSPTTERER